MKFWYDGNEVEVELGACSHCGLQPLPDEVKASIARYHRDHRTVCAFCGDSFRVSCGRVIHVGLESKASPWLFMPESSEQVAEIEVVLPGARPRCAVHVRCLARALPHAGWPTLLFGETK